jgi:hypothetical protein
MKIDQFISDKSRQLVAYSNAVFTSNIHYTELDLFILDLMDEWTLLKVTDDNPHNALERVFWHLIHEIHLHGAKALTNDLYIKSEVTACLDFVSGTGSYPIDCVGLRPLA